jgi:hypothetical protein
MERAHSTHGRQDVRNAYKSLVGKPEGKRLLEKSWLRWKDNIRKVDGKVGWKFVFHKRLGTP